MAYETYQYLKNTVQAELDSRAYSRTNVFGDGVTDKIDEWLEESEQEAYLQPFVENPAFIFTFQHTIEAEESSFPYPTNWNEWRRVVASVGSDERIVMTPTSPDIILNIPQDITTRIPAEYADYRRSNIVIPVEQDVTITATYHGYLDPISEVDDDYTTDEGDIRSHYLLNVMGKWLKYDACIRGGVYFRMDQSELDRWAALRDQAADNLAKKARRQEWSGPTPRRAVPSKYSITPRRRRGYY